MPEALLAADKRVDRFSAIKHWMCRTLQKNCFCNHEKFGRTVIFTLAARVVERDHDLIRKATGLNLGQLRLITHVTHSHQNLDAGKIEL
jgi:hypothetical protein